MCHNIAEPFSEAIVFTFDHTILLNQKLFPPIYFMYTEAYPTTKVFSSV